MSLKSIFQQSLTPDRLIIIVDGPIPSLLNYSLSSAIERASCSVHVERLPRNSGLWFTRNLGIEICETELVALHDADDVMHPQRLSIQTALFAKIQPSILGAAAIEFDVRSGQVLGVRRTPCNRILTLRDMWLRNPIHHSTVLLSREDVMQVGSYRSRAGAEDLDLWRRLLRNGALITNTELVLQALGTSNELLARRKMSKTMFWSESNLARDQLVSSQDIEPLIAPLSFLFRSGYRSLPIPAMKYLQDRLLRVADLSGDMLLDDYLGSDITTLRLLQ